MSMIKQLWIATAIVALLALGGSLVVSTLSARHYLEQQLHVKNIDNANSLALSMSQLPKDPVTLELLISAQFDAGHYEYIRLTDPEGRTLIARESTAPVTEVPEWFTDMIPIDANEGIAQMIFLKADRVCAVSYADKAGKYQNQDGLTLPKVD